MFVSLFMCISRLKGKWWSLTLIKMLLLSLQCDDTMWWRTDDFRWSFPSLNLELFMNILSHRVHLSFSSFCHAIFLLFDLLTAHVRSFFLTHSYAWIYSFKTWVVCLEFYCVPSMLMKRWCWDYFSIDFVYHVLYKHGSRQR
jgi:hypothetical protein